MGRETDRSGVVPRLRSKRGTSSPVVEYVTVQQHLCAGRVRHQSEGPVALKVRQVAGAVGVVLGQGRQVLAKEGLGAGRVLSRGLGRFVVGAVAGR